jgi:hypothetical protein
MFARSIISSTIWFASRICNGQQPHLAYATGVLCICTGNVAPLLWHCVFNASQGALPPGMQSDAGKPTSRTNRTHNKHVVDPPT